MQDSSKATGHCVGGAGRAGEVEAKLRVRQLPGRRYELRLGAFLPVEVGEATYRGKSVAELREMVEEWTLIAIVMVEKYDCNLVLRGRRFIEGEQGQFTLVNDDDAGDELPPFPQLPLQ